MHDRGRPLQRMIPKKYSDEKNFRKAGSGFRKFLQACFGAEHFSNIGQNMHRKNTGSGGPSRPLSRVLFCSIFSLFSL